MTDYLTPTASREQLIANDALNDTRDAIGAAITAWVQEQATHHRDTLADLVAVHHVALRHMATHYDDLGRAIIPLLPVETSAGTMSIAEYLETTHTVRYAATVDEYRQVSTIVAPDRPVINAGYTFIEDLLMRLPTLNPDVTVHKVAITEELHNLSPVPYDDAPKARSFEERATQALDLTHVTVTARSYTPDNLPALYVADPSVLQWMERDASKDVAQGPWADILAQTDSIYEGLGAKATAHLCLNWNNRAVRSLASVTDPIIMTRSIRLMYAQAKLSGHHPLTTADRTMLTQSLDDLITLSLGVPDTDFPEI